MRRAADLRDALRVLAPHLRLRRRSHAIGLAYLAGTSSAALAIPWVLKTIVEDLEAGRGEGRLFAAVGVMALLGVAQAVFRVGSRTRIFGAAREIELALRDDLVRRVLGLPPGALDRFAEGDVLSRIVHDVGHVRMVLGPGLLNAASSAFMFGVSLVMMSLLSAPLTVLTLAPLPVLAWGGRRFAALLVRRSRRSQESLAALTEAIRENLVGHAVVRAYAREDDEIERYEARNEEHFRIALDLIRTQAFLVPIMAASIAGATLVVVWAGGLLVTRGAMTLGEFLAFVGYLTILVWPAFALGWVASIVQRGRSALERLAELMSLDLEVEREGGRPLVSLPPPRGELAVRGLTLLHDGAARPALRDLDLEIEAGEVVALVGPTAAGKSTLLEVLGRLREVPEGTVFLDGADVRCAPVREVRGRVGWSPQDPFLFSATIAENISLGAVLPRERIAELARRVGLGPDLERMPHGLDTEVGERGHRLSTGQRQRIGLARALAVDPAVLLLDDPFSAVDAGTERQMLAGLGPELDGRTVVFSTHRMEALDVAGRAVVLDGGRLVQDGSPSELGRAPGLFADLVRRGRAARALAGGGP